MKYNVFLLLLLSIGTSCGEDYLPRPKAFLRLDYPSPQYKTTDLPVPFSFQTNTLATDIKLKKLQTSGKSYGIDITYPSLKGTIFLTYKAVKEDKKILESYLRDAQKLTLEHTIKADEIPRYPYENEQQKVYGELSEVKGNVASPVQFYVTDSVNHFLTGSLYFYAKPNYDSILPAAHYMQKDIRHIMETLQWK